jgi:hypothetical protein
MSAKSKASFSGLSLPESLRSHGVALLGQQCWCWGQDVRREAGNLLLAFGFERHRPPEGEKGASMYSLTPCSGQQVVLWGFGFWYGAHALGGIYVNRFQFLPLATRCAELTPPIWNTEQMQALLKPDCSESACLLLSTALFWIASYERWTQRVLGVAYREESLADYPQRILPAAEMPIAWERLAEAVLDAVRQGEMPG